MERLTFIFWQNINSMHQSAFLKALALQHDVTLITMQKGSGREEMGWHVPELPGVQLLHLSDINWKSLISQNSGSNAIHIFAGLHAFRPIHQAMLYALRQGCRIGVYAEPLVMKGLIGAVKQIRGCLDAFKFGTRIDFVLCIGKECRKQYLQWGFPEYKLHDWAYVTEPFNINVDRPLPDRPFKIIFPASCSKRKGADLLLEAAVSLPEDISFELTCYSLPANNYNAFERKMMARINGFEHIRLLPFMDNEKVRTAISESDLLVLPSRFDGWGAVVNEALGAGTPVLVSDKCGSSILIQEKPWLGEVFGPPEVATLRTALIRMLKDGTPAQMRRHQIKSWASNNISGPALAEHFLDVVAVAFASDRKQTTPRWRRLSS